MCASQNLNVCCLKTLSLPVYIAFSVYDLREREREKCQHVKYMFTKWISICQVTIAFWKAIGGDEDEIGDLSDLSDAEMP